eukprot:TRINITY_DN65190_c0_g1_i1.p1 TRINITY_DN65190_c0_g1~~TRINITY_DN65190_c0_g1_i1.p1  ORF type:complete len:856 (-),score=173.82 TRINITY_DN65190_c0_g1_i1:75-2642(-)
MGKGKPSPNSWKTLNFAKRRLTDEDLRGLSLSQESTHYEEVDFSQNKLTSAGLRPIVSLCCRCQKLRVLKVYKNEIDDAGAKELARLLEKCASIEEIHLSHNRLTARGVRIIAEAADWYRSESSCPLWLRLEQNLVESPTQFFWSLERRLSVCQREDERRCTTRVCCWKRKIHMPFLYLQREDWKAVEQAWEEDAWEEETWEEDTWEEEAWEEGAWHEKAWPQERKAWQRPDVRPKTDAKANQADVGKARADSRTQQTQHEARSSRQRRDSAKPREKSPEWTTVASLEEHFRNKHPEREAEREAEDLEDDPKKAESTVRTVEDKSPGAPSANSSSRKAKKKDKEDGEDPDPDNTEETNPVTAWWQNCLATAKSASKAKQPGDAPTEEVEWTGADAEGLLRQALQQDEPSSQPSRKRTNSGASSGSKNDDTKGKGHQIELSEHLAPRADFDFDGYARHCAILAAAEEASARMASEGEKDQVQRCLAALNEMIGSSFEEGVQWRASAFGSMESGFGTRGADLDVVLIDASSTDRNTNPPQTLMKLRTHLLDSDFSVRDIILSARVPILKLEYKGIDVDVSVNNVKPLVNTRLLKAYGKMDPMVTLFGVAVKIWAKEAKLCGGADGHLSSYAFTLMAIYYLQVSEQLPCLQLGGSCNAAFEDDDAAAKLVKEKKDGGWIMQQRDLKLLLAGFFAFYAGMFGPSCAVPPFEWGKEVVSIRLGRREPSNSEAFEHLRGRHEQRLHIEDPFELSRNLNDVLRTHPQTSNNEDKLFSEISMMDGVCRQKVRDMPHIRQQIEQMGHVPVPPFFDFEFPGPFGPQMAEAMMMYSQSAGSTLPADKHRKPGGHAAYRQKQKTKHK